MLCLRLNFYELDDYEHLKKNTLPISDVTKRFLGDPETRPWNLLPNQKKQEAPAPGGSINII